ncbi:hypothetical protein JCM14036_16490 [Desulfotomaculum defluvii]
MPTLSSMVIPIPKSWDEFEDICLSCLKIKWSSPNLTRHGRQGQPQAGVDVYGDDDLGQFVGVQCKLTNLNIDINLVNEEITKAETFVPELAVYYIATTSPADAKLQKDIRLFSKQRVSEGKFPVGILFWQDLIQELIINESEFKKHYPQLSIPNNDKISGERLLSLIDITYLGLNLKHYMDLIFGEIGQMVQEDPMQIESIALNIEACAIVLLKTEKLEELLKIIKEFREYVIPFVTGKEDRPKGWLPVENLATSIESRIEVIEYGLGGRELVVFNIGKILSRWYATETDNVSLSKDMENKLITLITELSPEKVIPDEIMHLFKEYRQSDSISVMHIPQKIYNLIRSMILMQEITARKNSW